MWRYHLSIIEKKRLKVPTEWIEKGIIELNLLKLNKNTWDEDLANGDMAKKIAAQITGYGN